jgi:uncharacterized protein (TIGR02687 family)
MNAKQVTDALAEAFASERIVFWNDAGKDFLTLFDGEMFSPVEGVSVIRLDQTPALQAKLRIEREEPETKFLLYSPTSEPEDPLDDWLFDIRLYARQFYADYTVTVLQDLGLTSLALREHLGSRRKFLDSKERFGRLKSLVLPEDKADDLDRKMVAVVSRNDQAEEYAILRALLHAFTETGEPLDLAEPPASWDEVEKFGLDVWFWRIVKKRFGYAEETPRLGNLLTRLFITDFAQSLKVPLPKRLENLLLPAAGRSNCVVFMGQWRDSASKGASFDTLSDHVADTLDIRHALSGINIEALLDVQTFQPVEMEIASNLKNRVLETADSINAEAISAIARTRQASHWASPSIPGAAPRKQLHAVYEALIKAAEFFELRNAHALGFETSESKKLFARYEKTLFRFDQLYRLFCEAADKTLQWNILKSLREEIERAYANWFVPTLALSWDRHVAALLPQAGGGWRLEGVPAQQGFYRLCVAPRLAEGDNRRAYVVISDAFRFEAAEELTRELNGKYRFTATLGSQLGVLPSYTALGMASLLPHQTLAYDTGGAVLVDGKPTAGLAARSGILGTVEGLAVRAEDLLTMRKEEGRDLVAGCKVVYVYHNVVDSTGDNAATESDTFAAVRQAIDQLSELVRYIVNNLNGNYVVVTADHGFLYADTPPAETDRSPLGDQPHGTVLAKKRYLLGRNLPEARGVFRGETKVTAGADGGMEFYVPKGTNRFHFSGGARFIHGGATLQEIVVPVVTIRHVKGKGKQETATKKVGVQVLGVNHRITVSKYRFRLLQTEPVSDRVKPVTLKVAIYDGDTPVTDIAAVTLDSESGSIDERTREVTLTLEDRTFDKRRPYRLVLRDAETDIELADTLVTIDRAFTDDF